MNVAESPLVIQKPSQKLLDFVRDFERQKVEMNKELIKEKNKYFPLRKSFL